VAELKGSKTEKIYQRLLLENLRQTEGISPLPNRLKKRAIRRLQNFSEQRLRLKLSMHIPISEHSEESRAPLKT